VQGGQLRRIVFPRTHDEGGKLDGRSGIHRSENSQKNGATTVVTTLKHPSGLRCEHHLFWVGNTPVFSSRVSVRHAGKKPVTLEMLSSFSLGGMTPYAPDDAPNRLLVHRYRSTWSAEGRLDTQSIEDLQLERSWTGHGIACERFG
jgi:alpha-galactosidase